MAGRLARPDAGPDGLPGVGNNANFSLVSATEAQLREWGYDVTDVPSITADIDGCRAQTGFERRLCWAELDLRVMMKIVPWMTWWKATQIRVVSARVIRFTFDQPSGVLPALDQIAVSSDAATGIRR